VSRPVDPGCRAWGMAARRRGTPPGPAPALGEDELCGESARLEVRGLAGWAPCPRRRSPPCSPCVNKAYTAESSATVLLSTVDAKQAAALGKLLLDAELEKWIRTDPAGLTVSVLSAGPSTARGRNATPGL
jgi:hypothetical protein